MYSAYVFGTIILIALITASRCALPSACVSCKQSRRCLPPDCYCCADELQITNVSLTQIPQMVFFTFDDAVTGQAAGFYKQLFDSSRKNPNGCPISMTLFISHENTQYAMVTEFHGLGMEIAAHSVTHSTMNGTNFFEEAKAQKENLAKLAGIPIEEITGWRSPFLKPTGDLQPDTLKNLGYKYDATLTFSKRSLREKPPGPFTLDFGFPYECQVKPCPKSKHPGFWEIPVVSLMDYKHAYDCVYVDGCMNAPPDEDAAYKFLWDNFLSYYTTTKMPFGINMHASWFYYPDRLKAMDRFIQKLVSLNDVYVVSVSKMIEWLKRPTPLQDLHSFAPWACDGRERAFDTGPRLVKTIGEPSPVPRSFIQWSNGPTVVHAPRPSTGTQRTLDLSRRQQAQLRQTERPRFAPRIIDPMFNTRRPDAAERLSSPTIGPSPRSQDFLLEQHEERLRQQRIVEERLRQQQVDIERHRLREAEMQSQSETERLRRLDFEQQQQLAAERQRQLEFERRLQIDAERQRQQENDRRNALQQQLETERQALQQRAMRERQQQLIEQRQAERQQQLMEQRQSERQQQLLEQRQSERQQQLLEQRQSERQQQLLEQRQSERQQQLLEQQLHRRHELLLQQRQQEHGGSGQLMHSPQDTIRNAPTEVQINKHIVWKPVIPSSISDDVISRVENRHWVPHTVQQEPNNVGRSLEISNSLRPDASQPPAVNLLQRIETPSKVGHIYITPAPPRAQSLITLRFSESPRHNWFTNMQEARGLSPNAPRSGRGGSNRRTGDQLQQTVPAQLQDQHVRHVQGGNVPNRQLHGMPQHASNRIPSQSIGRTISHPNIEQQIAWNSFIRQMLGPH